MANTRIKGRHTSIYVVVDNQTQIGSFTKCESFSAKPDATIEKTEFLGQPVAEGDLEHSGYDLSFTIHEEDTAAIDYWDKQVQKFETGQQLLPVTIVAITTYLNPAVAAKTETFEEVVLKHDERSFGGKKEYVKNMFTGFAPRKK